MQYRRYYIAGASYFFTVVTHQRSAIFAKPESVQLLRSCIQHVKRKHPFIINAAVIMPDHFHFIWTMPPDATNFSTRWRLIKTRFTQNYPHLNNQKIWQNRFWDHAIRDENDFKRHIDYIHYNPIRHGYVKQVKQWPHSSFHQYVKNGLLPDNWGSNCVEIPEDIGHE